jgi:hypothetical protein
VDILIRDAWSIILKEGTQPLERGSLGATSIANKVAGEVIMDEYPRCFPIKTLEILNAGFILGANTGEGEVNGKTLERDRSLSGGMGTRRLLGHLGTNTCGTRIEDGMHVAETRDTFNMLVSVKEVVIAGVTETVMPEKTFGISLDSAHRCVTVDVFMKRKIMKTLGDRR